LGQQVTFTTTLYESQGRFADYYNAYAESIATGAGDPGGSTLTGTAIQLVR
jgi:hypothetical protein